MSETSTRWLRAMPLIFVLIWSTGFVVARYGMPHAGPFGFLTLRFALSIVVFGAWIAWSRPAWPQSPSQWLHLSVAGVLMHAGYLGGVWVAVKAGLGAGLAALIVGLQPVLTALWLSGHRRASGGAGRASASGPAVPLRQWLGLGLGLLGLVLVVGNKLKLGEAHAGNVASALLALVSITAGTLYQKRWVGPCDVRTASTVQLLAAFAVMLPLAVFEAEPLRWHPELMAAMAWSVLVLTLGGSSLLYLLIQRGAATSVSSLMYLVPPCTALLAAFLFGESLGLGVLLGLALTAMGVAMAVKGSAGAASVQGRPGGSRADS